MPHLKGYEAAQRAYDNRLPPEWEESDEKIDPEFAEYLEELEAENRADANKFRERGDEY